MARNKTPKYQQIYLPFDEAIAEVPQTSEVAAKPQVWVPIDIDSLMQASFDRNLRRYFRGRFPGGTNISFGTLRRGTFRTIGLADIAARKISLHQDLLREDWVDVRDFVMYHEMLHFSEFHHNARFRARERRFDNFETVKSRETEFFRWLEERYGKRLIYIYRCPQCEKKFPFRSRRGHHYACGRCGTRQHPVRLEYLRSEKHWKLAQPAEAPQAEA